MQQRLGEGKQKQKWLGQWRDLQKPTNNKQKRSFSTKHKKPRKFPGNLKTKIKILPAAALGPWVCKSSTLVRAKVVGCYDLEKVIYNIKKKKEHFLQNRAQGNSKIIFYTNLNTKCKILPGEHGSPSQTVNRPPFLPPVCDYIFIYSDKN